MVGTWIDVDRFINVWKHGFIDGEIDGWLYGCMYAWLVEEWVGGG